MDPVIFTGRVPLEELKHDKPAEYEQILAGRTEARSRSELAGPSKPRSSARPGSSASPRSASA